MVPAFRRFGGGGAPFFGLRYIAQGATCIAAGLHLRTRYHMEDKIRDGRPVRLTVSQLSKIENIRIQRGIETGKIPSRDLVAREMVEAGLKALGIA